MAYGLEIRDSNNKIVIGENQTFVRFVDSVRVPLHTGVTTSTYSVPNFDDTLGMFTWATESYGKDSTGENYTTFESLIFYDSLHWNNNTKVFTVNHRSVGSFESGTQGAYVQFYFIHFR